MTQTDARRPVILILIAILILQGALPTVAVAAGPVRSFDDSFDLMVAARGILIEEDSDDGSEIAGGSKAFSIRRDVPPDSPAEQILVRLINATKKQLGDLEQACKEMRNSFSEEGQDCEEKLSKAYCDENIPRLRARLSFLRKVRGDRRKGFTKAWHSIKRAGARLWRNVGPIGRRFLRNLGDEAFAVVKSGGSLHGGVLRRLVIKHAKTVVRREGRRILTLAAQRVIIGRARDPGDVCVEEQVAEEPQESQATDCLSQDWFEAEWAVVEELLIREGKFCQKTAVRELRTCLWEKAINGVCRDEAFNACDSYYLAIPANDAGGSVTTTGQTQFLDAVPNEVTITYPSAGGGVTGNIHLQRYDDVFGCTYTATSKFAGTYDPTTCTMNGEATSELLYEGYCVSVCGSSPASPTSCPVKFTVTTVWKATLEDGVLSGSVGDQSCERGCIGGFQAPGYLINP